jgi:PPOX class probable F420-dependent enzyme
VGIVRDVGSTAFDVASTRYIAFTTFRRNGDAVVTPVWVADLGDGTVGFTTLADSGKVKRLGANAEVRISPCTMRGVVHAGTPSWKGTARVVRGADYARVRHAIKRRYHVQLLFTDLVARLRHQGAGEVGVVVSFADADLGSHGR